MVNHSDQQVVNKILSGSLYSTADFSTFMRVLNQNPRDEQLIDRFVKDLPSHINNLDYLDARKAISVVLANPSLHHNDQLLNLLKNKFSEIKSEKGIDHNSIKIKIGGDLKSQPVAFKFWALFAKTREFIYMNIRKYGFNLK
jgi:hypothetical protein